MKCLLQKIIVIFLIIPASLYAGWQVAKPSSAVPSEPFFQAGTPRDPTFIPAYGNAAFPNRYAAIGRPASVYAISISGSLKENIERIMCRYHWRVAWKAPYDYNFDGRVTGSSLPDVIDKILKPFPLKATLYMSNHTLMVIPKEASNVA